MIRTASTKSETPFDLSFDVEIESASPTAKSQTSFAVHHSIASYPTDERLRGWCIAEAMIPWTAVAAQISVSVMTQKKYYGSNILIGRCSSNEQRFPLHRSASADPY